MFDRWEQEVMVERMATELEENREIIEESFKHIVEMQRMYYDKCIERFSEEQALYLTAMYFSNLQGGNNSEN